MKHITRTNTHEITTENKNIEITFKEQTAIHAPVLATLAVALHVYGDPHSALHK